MEEKLLKVCDIASDAISKIQQKHENLDPIVGVNQKMRQTGIPADILTIDCLRSGKRIILILHDQQPEFINYQFSYKEKDPEDEFETEAYANVSSQTIIHWVESYFLQ